MESPQLPSDSARSPELVQQMSTSESDLESNNSSVTQFLLDLGQEVTPILFNLTNTRLEDN